MGDVSKTIHLGIDGLRKASGEKGSAKSITSDLSTAKAGPGGGMNTGGGSSESRTGSIGGYMKSGPTSRGASSIRGQKPTSKRRVAPRPGRRP